MPSPFPGMDPYLERAERWSGVHTRLIAVIGEILARQVAPRFFVDSEDNVYILGLDDPARSVVRPDPYMVEAVSAAGPARANRSPRRWCSTCPPLWSWACPTSPLSIPWAGRW